MLSKKAYSLLGRLGTKVAVVKAKQVVFARIEYRRCPNGEVFPVALYP